MTSADIDLFSIKVSYELKGISLRATR